MILVQYDEHRLPPDSMNSKSAILIMAAGRATRFRHCKQLVNVNGQPLIQHCLDTTKRLNPDNNYILSGAWHSELQSAMQNGSISEAGLIYHPHWAQGLGSSIACGIRQLEADYDAVMVILADQIAVDYEDLIKLMSIFSGKNIACSKYKNRRGVPAVFGRNSFPELMQLNGDKGAKSLLYSDKFPVEICPMDNAAIDIDTQEDLQQWIQDHPDHKKPG